MTDNSYIVLKVAYAVTEVINKSTQKNNYIINNRKYTYAIQTIQQYSYTVGEYQTSEMTAATQC